MNAKQPAKPTDKHGYIRVSDAEYRAAKMAAVQDNVSLAEWLGNAIRAALKERNGK